MGAEAAIGGAVLGGVAGAQEDVTTQTREISLPLQTRTEVELEQEPLRRFRMLEEFAAVGPGRPDVARAFQAQRELAETVGRGPAVLLSRGQAVAERLFAPQRLALQQQFEQAGIETGRLSAQLGRQVDDPILRAKLAQAQGRQLGVLGAQQGAVALQLGQQFGQQQLTGQVGRAQILGGLGQQAFGTQQALLGLGSQLIQTERAFRLQQAGQTVTGVSGGGLKGAITGALGGAAGGLKLAQGFGGGGGISGTPSPFGLQAGSQGSEKFFSNIA